MALWQWSTTPANNASAGSIDWAEGQPPSTVNDSARQMMADVAVWYQSPEWLNYGLPITYVSATQFTVTGNQTLVYSVGRRVKTYNTAGVLYGTITASAYTSLTTVTVTIDNGGSMDSGLSEVDVGINNPTNPSFLYAGNNFTVAGQALNVGLSTVNTDTNVILSNSNTVARFFNSAATGVVGLIDNTRSITRWFSDTAGNFTAAGTITANSDETLKRNWEDLAPDFLEKLAAVKSGTFERITTGERSAGVSAQSLQKVLPESVLEGPDGLLSVAYGQAALVAVVELAKEVKRLRELLESKS